MTGLILKDMLILRKTFRSYGIFLVLYAAMALAGIFPVGAMASVTQIIIMMLPMSAFAIDEHAKWDRYALTFPAGRRAVVGARYLFALVMAAFGALFSLAAILLLSAIQGGGWGPLLDNLASLLVSLGMGLVICDFLLPLCFKLGVERARPYMYLIVFAPVVVMFLLMQMEVIDLSAMNAMDTALLMACFAAVPLLALLGMAPSWLASLRIMEKKEF